MSAAPIAQSTRRGSSPVDWTTPALGSVTVPTAAVAGEGKRQAEACGRPSG